MEFWPADFRTNLFSPSTQKKRKGKATYVNESCLELGSLGAATLVEKGGSSEWITTVQTRRKAIPQVVGKALEVFPPTKPLPSSPPRLSVHRQAEQGARFLRARHPDVDVPFGLLKDELQSNEDEAAAYSVLDPYAGNRLAHFSFASKQKQDVHLLAFPSGETGSDLNISPFRVTGEKQIVFTPSAIPALSFNTPIQQVVTVPPKHEISYGSSLLAVRTHATVSIIDVRESPVVQQETSALAANTVIAFSSSDTGGRRVVDVSGKGLSSSSAEVLLVNEFGAVYNCSVGGGAKTMIIAPNGGENEPSQTDKFWRVVRQDSNTGLRSSSKKVQWLDMRDPMPVGLFELKDETFLTSIEAPLAGRHLMCFSTTKKLVWVDERNQKVPVLSLKHQRAFDRTLCAETVDYGISPLTMLSSSANALVTVYDVNYGPSGHIHVYGEPSMLTNPQSAALPFAGFTAFRHSAESAPVFNIFRLSSRGSLWRTKVAVHEDSDTSSLQDVLQPFEWDAGVRAVAAKTMAMSEEIPPSGGREYLDANLREAYETIFQMHQTTSTETDAEAAYQTLEKMPFFWQDMDGSAEHMLLTFDVAFRSGMEPSVASRADFLTKSLLSSPQGFVELIRKRVLLPRLVSTARWHHDLKSLPSVMVPNIATNSQMLFDQLRKEALAHTATAEGMKRATEAAQDVAIDLALSRHVYATKPFALKGRITSTSHVDDSNLLLQATQAMSLGATEPPPVRFGFLRPAVREPYEEEEMMENADEKSDVGVEMPLAVRLLVSQWEIGTDPQKYAYNDPYEALEVPSGPRKSTLADSLHPSGTQGQPRPIVPPIISVQRGPPVVAATGRPNRNSSMFEPDSRAISKTFSSVRRPASSQEVHGSSTPLFSSQNQEASTQPLPGAFGGGDRQRKKVVKKRMGGF